jgi:hypothetical protein
MAGAEGLHVQSDPRRPTVPAPGAAMTAMSGLVARVRSYWITEPEIRAETWALGGRHQGRVLEGARSESKAPGLSFRRAILLKAVIRSVGKSEAQ